MIHKAICSNMSDLFPSMIHDPNKQKMFCYSNKELKGKKINFSEPEKPTARECVQDDENEIMDVLVVISTQTDTIDVIKA
mmetsp:Transcript_18870/g.28695  ORF Transcript_18870/g.28695 Transcript_18870/m.28695 type:complete len:80 (-) Transcript_18870:12-251(-)